MEKLDEEKQGAEAEAEVMLEIDEDKPPAAPVIGDAPRKRLYGKQTVRPQDGRQQPPTLRALQVGGEEDWAPNNRAGGSYPMTQWEELMVQEHHGLTLWANEERRIAHDQETINVMLQAERTVQELEEKLQEGQRKVRKVWSKQEDEEEVLQTRVVSPEEVRQDLEAWRPIFLRSMKRWHPDQSLLSMKRKWEGWNKEEKR